MMIARGCGMDLNFNSMFVLVLMLRYTLTWLRSTWLRHYLPIDQNVLLHEIVGTVIFVQGVAHGLAHFVHIRKYIHTFRSTHSRSSEPFLPKSFFAFVAYL